LLTTRLLTRWSVSSICGKRGGQSIRKNLKIQIFKQNWIKAWQVKKALWIFLFYMNHS